MNIYSTVNLHNLFSILSVVLHILPMFDRISVSFAKSAPRSPAGITGVFRRLPIGLAGAERRCVWIENESLCLFYARDFQAASRAISIISWKESCRSWAERASPVKMWSEMVRMESACLLARWAVQ